MRQKNDYIYIKEEAYSREVVLIGLENLCWLQCQSIKLGTTPSELINKLIKEHSDNEI